MPNYLGNISEYSTKELVEELIKREGVEKLTVAPYSEYKIEVDANWDGSKDGCEGEGSAIILTIID